MSVNSSPSRCNRDTSPPERILFSITCGGFSLSHFSCFFFRKRRNKRNQTEREKRRKTPQSRWALWRNGSFASSAQTVSRLLGETAGTIPVRKSDSTGFARLLRWWGAKSFARHLPRKQRKISVCEYHIICPHRTAHHRKFSKPLTKN